MLLKSSLPLINTTNDTRWTSFWNCVVGLLCSKGFADKSWASERLWRSGWMKYLAALTCQVLRRSTCSHWCRLTNHTLAKHRRRKILSSWKKDNGTVGKGPSLSAVFRAAMSEESARPAKGRSLINAVTVTKDKWGRKYFLIRHRILNVSILNQQVGWENRCPVSLIKHANGWVESVCVTKADRNCSAYLSQAVTKDRNLSIFCKGMASKNSEGS